MSFDRINYSQNFYEQDKNFVFDGSILLGDGSTYLTYTNGKIYLEDPCIGSISLTELTNPSLININLGNIVFISTNGTENGELGNPSKPFDISTAVNTQYATHPLFYVYSGDYNLPQYLCTTPGINWKFYFEPGATVDFGDASYGPFSAVIGQGATINIYGYGSFIARHSMILDGDVDYFEFDELTAQNKPWSYSLNNTILKGRKITQEVGLTNNQYAFLGKHNEIDEIYMNSGYLAAASNNGNGSVTKIKYLFSNYLGIQLRNAGGKQFIDIGRIDASFYGIYAVNTNSCIGSEIFIGDINITGSGQGIYVMPDNTKITVNNLYVTSHRAIDIGGAGNNIEVNVNRVISSSPNNYVIYAQGSTKATYNINYLEAQNYHGVYYYDRSDNGEGPNFININTIICPSTMRGIYLQQVTNTATDEELIFKNAFIDAGYPVYCSGNMSVYDQAKYTFQNCELYARNDNESVYANYANFPIKFVKTYANTDPHSNVMPLWDGIVVTDKLTPIV